MLDIGCAQVVKEITFQDKFKAMSNKVENMYTKSLICSGVKVVER